jgi:hypothetical protein
VFANCFARRARVHELKRIFCFFPQETRVESFFDTQFVVAALVLTRSSDPKHVFEMGAIKTHILELQVRYFTALSIHFTKSSDPKHVFEMGLIKAHILELQVRHFTPLSIHLT